MLEKLSPEGFEIVNAYITSGSAAEVANSLRIPVETVMKTLDRPDAKRYLDRIYMEQGWRNRSKLAALMDEIIDAKLTEARENEIYTSKDLLDIIALQHKMKMDEIKAAGSGEDGLEIKAGGQYAKLMERLLTGNNDG